MQTTPLRRPRTLAQGLVEQLSAQIRDGRLAPHTKLPTEGQVMQAYGVSRTVVREALSRLQAAGLVATRHGIGTFVVGPGAEPAFSLGPQQLETLRDVIAVLELRLGVETEAAGLAAQRRTADNLAVMRAALDEFADAVEAVGLPPGVVNVVAAGREASDHLVRHPGIDKVAFTGSTATGRHIGSICGEQLKRCSLELGGKSAAIVLEDFDLTSVPELIDSGMLNNGQACLAQTRILAPRSRYNEVVDAMATHVAAMVVGDSLDPGTDIGPMVTARQRDRVVGYLEIARDEGARAVTGGSVPADRDRGWFVEPTVLAGVDNSMRVAREEIFGPVLSVIPYDGEDEAVAIANDSDYGLSGSVWSADADHARDLATRVRTGTVAINTQLNLDWHSPFGGMKNSGVGRELGPEGIDQYVEYQSIIDAPG